jgi:hypothetical protein
MREYTRNQTLIANLPYAAMVALGMITIVTGLGFSAATLAGAAGYLVYGIAGAVWIMVFVCRYCDYHGTRGCPCGYGLVSRRHSCSECPQKDGCPWMAKRSATQS